MPQLTIDSIILVVLVNLREWYWFIHAKKWDFLAIFAPFLRPAWTSILLHACMHDTKGFGGVLGRWEARESKLDTTCTEHDMLVARGNHVCVYRCVYVRTHASRVISFVFNLLVTREIIMCICVTIWDRIWFFLYLNFFRVCMCVCVAGVWVCMVFLHVCPYSLHCQLLVWLWLSSASFSLCHVHCIYWTTSFWSAS